MDKKDIVDVIADILSDGRTIESRSRSLSRGGGENQSSSSPHVGAMSRRAYSSPHAQEEGGHLAKKGFFASASYNVPFTSLKNTRPFISEYDLRCMLKDNPTLTVRIPHNAIISPLALEIIETRGVRIIYV